MKPPYKYLRAQGIYDKEKSNEWPLPKTIRYGTIGRMPQGILYHRISHIGSFNNFLSTSYFFLKYMFCKGVFISRNMLILKY